MKGILVDFIKKILKLNVSSYSINNLVLAIFTFHIFLNDSKKVFHMFTKFYEAPETATIISHWLLSVIFHSSHLYGIVHELKCNTNDG